MEAMHDPKATCAECGGIMPFVGPAGGCPMCMFAAGSEGLSEPDETGEPGWSSSLRYGHFEVAQHLDGSPHELGRGAMGISYLARDTTLDCQVALKVIAAPLSTRADARARFRREARAAAKLQHPNVASVFHYGEQGPHCFYAMEFVDGETLDARVKRDGPLAPALTLEIAAQVARALVAAEAQGIIHRDLKPSNLMLRGAGEGGGDGTLLEALVVKVIDFGLAKAVAGAAADQTRGFVGTPAFASPEQFSDAGTDATSEVPGSSDRIDIRSDIYSLGVTLWFLLTGKTPFVGRTLSEIHNRQTRQPLPLEHLNDAGAPAPVVALLRRMLAADPAERPQTPRELAAEIRRCQSGDQTSPPPQSGVLARRRWLWPAVGVSVLLVAALVAVGLHRSARKEAPEASSPALPSNEERSVAVLPFDNLSDDKDDAFFADGLQDDVITSLAKVRNLKVIGRASVMGYRGAGGAEKLREIAQTLGVHSLLEGTVRRVDDRVVVSAHLIDARNGRQLWGETYDRTLSDALSLRGELARAVASALQVALSPEEGGRLERPPTNSADAYALYLRGEALYKTRQIKDARAAQTLFTQAVKLDPAFALARAKLCLVQARIYEKTSFVPPAQFQAEALPSAQEAARLQPDLAEAHHALSLCAGIVGDFERARSEIEIASRLAPNDGEILNSRATLYEGENRYAEARALRERAVVLNPQDANLWSALSTTCCAMHDWPAAARAQDRVVLLKPDDPMVRWMRARVQFRWTGDLEPLQTFFQQLSTAEANRNELLESRAYLACYERDYTTAESMFERCILALRLEDEADRLPVVVANLGLLQLTRNSPGDLARARENFECALPGFLAMTRVNPAKSIPHADLAELLACLGQEEEARVEIKLALDLRSRWPEPFAQITMVQAAVDYSRLRDADRALPMLEHLLSTPSMLGVQQLRFGPEWDPIREDPRFQALVRRGETVTASSAAR